MVSTKWVAPREDWRPYVEELPTAEPDGLDPIRRLAVLRTVEGTLGDVIRTKLGAPMARAGAAARLLAGHVNHVHAPAMDEIVGAIDRTEDLLNDVLEFLHATVGGGLRVNRRRTNLRSLCERVLDAMQGRHPAHGLSFESDAHVDGQWDPDAIASLVARLVLNAVQHGPARSVVRVRLRGLEGRAVLEVTSAGSLPADVAPHRLFEPFVCARPRLSDGEAGLGLGLYLAERVAHAHRGRIEFENHAGGGLTFRVILPLF